MVCFGLWLSHQETWQLDDVAGDASSLVHGEHVRYVGISASLAPIDVGERLPVGVLHFIAARYLFDRPRRREAARHLIGSTIPYQDYDHGVSQSIGAA